MGREWFKSLDNTPNRRGGGAPDQEKPSLEAATTAPKAEFQQPVRGLGSVDSVDSVAIHSGRRMCRDGLRLSRWLGLLPDGNVLPRKYRMNQKELQGVSK